MLPLSLNASQQIAALEKEEHLLTTQSILLHKIQDLADARAQLHDGDPCPLCGAIEHPYAAGNIPTPNQTQEALERAKSALKLARKQLAEYQRQEVATITSLEKMAERQQEESAQLATYTTLLQQAMISLGVDETSSLTQRQQETESALQTTASIVHSAEITEREVQTARHGLEQARHTYTKIEKEVATLTHEQTFAEQTVVRLKQELQDITERLNHVQQETCAAILPYGYEAAVPWSSDRLQRIYHELVVRRDRWQEQQQQHVMLEQDIIALTATMHHQHAQWAQQEVEQQQRHAEIQQLVQEYNQLQQERYRLFGDKRTDVEEQQWTLLLETDEKQVETARQDREQAQHAHLQVRHQITSYDNAIRSRSVRLQQVEAACLPKEEQEQLEQAIKQLSEERTQLLKAMGAMQQKLQDHALLQQEQQEKIAAREAQQQESARWRQLYELIGSADGKKYRNFAQGLTFEIMIDHANRQLQKMSDRYLLTREHLHSLDLHVIDSDQGGEIRSTKNLSGGESFIVSLSLALGLSQMASRNVRVDSLFLDEGFGTLDEESLDTALTTLAGLHQDGKLIGVISHVATLKERIRTQIEIIPQKAGRSAIKGPGCRRINPSQS